MVQFTNTPLQVGVDYSGVALEGAFISSIPYNIDSLPFGTNLADAAVLPYGGSVIYDTDGGVTVPVGGTSTVTDIAGFTAYRNNGITGEAGLENGGLYSLVPVLNFGRIYVPVTTGASLSIGDTVSLNLAAGAEFNTVREHPGSPAATDLDISTIASVAEPSNGGFVLLTIREYRK